MSFSTMSLYRTLVQGNRVMDEYTVSAPLLSRTRASARPSTGMNASKQRLAGLAMGTELPALCLTVPVPPSMRVFVNPHVWSDGRRHGSPMHPCPRDGYAVENATIPLLVLNFVSSHKRALATRDRSLSRSFPLLKR